MKVKSLMGHFDTLKLSRLEAEYLADIPIRGKRSLERIGARLIEQGVNRVFITLGKDGVFFQSRTGCFFRPVPYVKPVSASGAGDAFMAGIVYGTLQGWQDGRIAEFASAMSALTLESETSVSGGMCRSRIARLIRERRSQNGNNW
jgi:pseudouridine kinase